jgi:CRP-like cAMP-binding protein
MARDVRQLRTEASDAFASGKFKRALVAYLELEQLEPRDAQWSKRAGETYRRLGKDKDAVSAFTRAADRYAQGGFLVQALAVCKLILTMDPKNDDALRRLASMNEQVGAGPTRALAMVDANPTLADNAAVAALRTGRQTSASGLLPAFPDPSRGAPTSTAAPASVEAEAPPIAMPRTRTPHNIAVPRRITPQAVAQAAGNQLGNAATPPAGIPSGEGRERRPGSTPPPIAIARTKSKPITLPPDQPIEMISLKDEIPESFEREEDSGIYVIPIDEPISGIEIALPPDDDAAAYADQYADQVDADDDTSAPRIEIEDPGTDTSIEDIDEVTELELEEVEEIALAEPRLMGAAAAQALASTPLFAGLSQEALESLVQQLTLVHLGVEEVLFHEGDPGDALYVIVEGEVSVSAEGPPRVEMARLGAGSFIGEVALMTDQPRSATVTATQDAELLRIDRKTLSTVLSEHGEILSAVLRFVRDRLVDRWTRTSPLFRPFDAQQRAELAGRFKFLEIDPGKVLIPLAKKPDGLYIVLAGSFVLRRGTAQVAKVGAGELIGETALLSGAPFKSEVVAQGKCLALCLPASDFRELIMTHPSVLEYIGSANEQSRKLEIL